jgi:hypothetical protein
MQSMVSVNPLTDSLEDLCPKNAPTKRAGHAIMAGCSSTMFVQSGY